jgi:hypothetical protein
MSMNWTSLTAAKGTAGSIANFISYGKVTPEVPVILDEAQTLLYTLLRTREMRTKFRFYMQTSSAVIALPARFLDPIGRMYALDWNLPFDHKDESFISQNRNYSPQSGTLGTNPFTTVNGSTLVNVNIPAHGFTQESGFYTTGATLFNGVTINGTFDVVAIVDVNNFTIDITPLGVLPSAGGAGGGTAATYVVNILVPGTPKYWAIWDEAIHFDEAFNQAAMCELPYFQSLPLLSATNQTNFLTSRYPHLIRPACLVRAAAFQRDDASYQRELTALTALTQAVSVENDMFYRGMVLDTDIP